MIRPDWTKNHSDSLLKTIIKQKHAHNPGRGKLPSLLPPAGGSWLSSATLLALADRILHVKILFHYCIGIPCCLTSLGYKISNGKDTYHQRLFPTILNSHWMRFTSRRRASRASLLSLSSTQTNHDIRVIHASSKDDRISTLCVSHALLFLYAQPRHLVNTDILSGTITTTACGASPKRGRGRATLQRYLWEKTCKMVSDHAITPRPVTPRHWWTKLLK